MSENITDKVEVSVFHKAKHGNQCSGDSYFYSETEEEFVCALADGLGSGEVARESSNIVIDIIKNNEDATVEQLVKKANDQLLGKRGVVIGIFKIDFKNLTYSFASIGNIGLMIVKDGKKKRNIPNAGYLGGFKRPFPVKTDKLGPKTNFYMFSDGVSDRELSNIQIAEEEIKKVIDTFAYTIEKDRKDDTTLIAMRYEG
ncbi:indirect negative regulator of sigma-B activity [Oceanobacillus piezotolerans]|uniref:Indirect negative regulator of sigma-B activity n=1 Tax=Oceanobacillus piezotolerans TaxID=2448030 RepID=A0A498DAY6_9BACI|nr:SpoIIE family protein phosphatase [Oceanobacillus piezotolerans]RLL42148.1 indirect negative regulator of sigma-B activity [Oceanobacillus piezotolerans]